MDELEDQVAKLQEQKAAIEASNEELKRQNKYWEDLFAKQQLLPPPQ
jgi:FtsZ-binding cell division protein ZapB